MNNIDLTVNVSFLLWIRVFHGIVKSIMFTNSKSIYFFPLHLNVCTDTVALLFQMVKVSQQWTHITD